MKYKGSIFNNKKLDKSKAKAYGFILDDDYFILHKPLMDNTFELTIKISNDGVIDTKVIESATNEEYELIHVSDASGKFVGKMRDEFENLLTDIAAKCYVLNVFKSDYANDIINYINKKYSAEPEYLWEKFPNNAIFRDNKSAKWYAALLTVKKRKVNIDEDGDVEIIDLKAKPEIINTIVDNNNYLPGYHMNKKHWFTIRLDGSVDIETIYNYIDLSYKTVVK